jgi:hypothetical protein
MKRLKVYLAVLANVFVLNGFTQVDCTNVTSTICNGTAALYHLNVDPATIVWHGMGIVPKIYTQYGDFNRSNLCCGAYCVSYNTYDGEPMVVAFEITNSINLEPCMGISVGLGNYHTSLFDCFGTISATPFSSQCGNFNGNPPFSYIWSNGATSADLVNICPGKYIVVQTDSLGCAAANSLTIDWFTGPGMPWLPYWYHAETEELTNKEKTIVKITDIMGRECELDAGELRIVLYSDGTIKKVIAN